jgi:glycosyltransferase involved in cell wall biosynthesis
VKGRRVFIGAVQEPFVRHESDHIIHQVYQGYRQKGWEADIVSIPFRWYFRRRLLGQILSWRLIDLIDEGPDEGHRVDRVLATRFPSYVVQHPCKIVWFFSHQPGLYGEAPAFPGPGKETEEAGRLRELFVSIDTKSLREAKKIFAPSEAVAEQLKTYNDVQSEVLYPVPRLKEKMRSGRFGDFLLAVGRFGPSARFDLLLRALAHARSPVRCVIAAAGAPPPSLQALQEQLALTDRVRFVSSPAEEDMTALYGECFAVASVASYDPARYRLLEALFAGKPVITMEDAADAREFVIHRETGSVCAPRPEALAQAVQELYDDRIKSHQLGDAGCERAARYSWDFVMDKLTAVY